MLPTRAQTPRRLPARAALAVALLASAGMCRRAGAAEVQGQARASVGSGYDSNAGHDIDGQAQGDGVVLAVLQLQGALFPADSTLAFDARYDLGAKKFFVVEAQDLVAQQGSLEGSVRAGPLTLGLLGAAKDSRSRIGDRDYSDFTGAFFGDARPHKWPLRFSLGAELFQFHPDPEYTFAGPDAELSAIAPVAAHHRLQMVLDGAFRSYAAASTVDGNRRRDGVLGAGLGYRYAGRLIAELSYDFLADLSNQLGRSYFRHRVTGSLAVFLPLHIALAATGALQFSAFPDGVIIIPDSPFTNEGDDENTNSLTLSLSRSFAHGWQVQLKGAGYQSDYATNGFSYHRGTVELDVGWKG